MSKRKKKPVGDVLEDILTQRQFFVDAVAAGVYRLNLDDDNLSLEAKMVILSDYFGRVAAALGKYRKQPEPARRDEMGIHLRQLSALIVLWLEGEG